jgi:hypothetical protein
LGPSPRPGFIPDLGKKILQFHELKTNEVLAKKRYQLDETSESSTIYRECLSPGKMSPLGAKSRCSQGSRASHNSMKKYSMLKSKFFQINHLRDTNP